MSLILQGMYTQAAETMWNNLTEKLNDCNHILTLAQFGLESFLQSFQARKFQAQNFLHLFSLMNLFFRISTIVKNYSAR